MAGRMKKKFDFGQDIYYFNIKNVGPNSITIKREKKEEAIRVFLSYKKMGKTCEWLGRWHGRKFHDTDLQALIDEK